MPAIDDLAAIRHLLDVPQPTDDVTTVGRARLEELIQQESGGLRPGRSRRRATAHRRRRVGVLAAGASLLAGAAAVAAVLALDHPQSAQPGAAAHANRTQTGVTSTAPGAVRQAILTAIGSAGGDVMHLTVTTAGGPPVARGVAQYWWWPAKAAPGQQVHLLIATEGGTEAVTFSQPAAPAGNPSQLQEVPASGIFVDQAAKTWSRISQYPYEGVVAATTRDLLDESFVRSTFLAESTIINEHAKIDGRTAIEINAPSSSVLRVLFWFDAKTYLPLRQVKLDSGATNNPATKKVYDYQFLPATSANRAKLTLAIPHGYRQASS